MGFLKRKKYRNDGFQNERKLGEIEQQDEEVRYA